MIRPDALARLAGRRLARRLEVREEVDSTMDLSWRLAEIGALEGTVVAALRQTAGRGRFGRVWRSPPGGLWVSVLADPPESGPRAGGLQAGGLPAGTLPIAAALAAARGVREISGLEPSIRWPNDCVVRGKKVAGVLVEGRQVAPRAPRFSIGIGIDVNVPADELACIPGGPATSLAIETGREYDLGDLLCRLVDHLDRLYACLAEGKFVEIESEWRERSSTLGRRIRLSTPVGVVEGLVTGLALDGGITLRAAGGGERTFRGEHCSLLSEEGP